MREQDLERRALLVSIWAAVVLGLLAMVWGLTTGARVVLLDGGNVLLGVLLSGVSLRAVDLIERGPTRRYPYGRESLAPMVVLLQGLALLAMLVYAAADAVVVIRQGGADVSTTSVAAYGLVTALASWWVARRLHALDPVSDLVAAEVAQWRSGIALSTIVALGASAAALLHPVIGDTPTRYIDPALVLLACALLVAVPLRLGISAVRELTETTAPPAIHDAVVAAVEASCAQHGLADPMIRETKLGRRLYLDVEVLVPQGGWDVAATDELRRDLIRRLGPLDLDPWISLSLTADPDLLHR